MTEQLKWYIENYWLFEPGFENTPIAQAAKRLGPNDLCYTDPISIERKLSFEQLMFRIPEKELKQILAYLGSQMQVMIMNKAQGTIPWFIDQLGARLTAILNIRTEKNKKNKE